MEEMELAFQKIIDDAKKDIEISYVEYVKDGSYNYLRVYIENKNGITSLDDCEEISKLIGDEAEKRVKESFMLEVSTPGIERKLTKEKDFHRFVGEKIELRTKNNVYDMKKFIGILKGFADGKVLIDEYEIPFEKMKSAKLVFDFNDIKEMGVKK